MTNKQDASKLDKILVESEAVTVVVSPQILLAP